MKHTPYVDFEKNSYEGYHITRVGCMKCNDTIGSKDPTTNQFYFWDHKRDLNVVLSNGSVARIPVCVTCSNSVIDEDVILFENTMKHGWMLEQSWALQRFPERGRDSVIRAGKWAKDIFIMKRGN